MECRHAKSVRGIDGDAFVEQQLGQRPAGFGIAQAMHQRDEPAGPRHVAVDVGPCFEQAMDDRWFVVMESFVEAARGDVAHQWNHAFDFFELTASTGSGEFHFEVQFRRFCFLWPIG